MLSWRRGAYDNYNYHHYNHIHHIKHYYTSH